MSKSSPTNVTFNYDYDTGIHGQLYVSSSTSDVMFTDSNGRDFKIGEMMDRIETLENQLAIIVNASPDELEKHKMLREAYNKYKFIEGLIGKDDDSR